MSLTKGHRYVSTVILSAAVFACDANEPGDEPSAEDLVTQSEDVDDLGASETMLAERLLEVQHGDYTLTFLKIDDSVAVVEYAPSDAPPLLDTFASQDASALEVLRALAPDADAPDALVAAHDTVEGIRSATALPVRDFTPQVNPFADGESATTQYYQGTCSFAGDGQTFFDGWWQSLGWDWHWYTYLTPTGNYLLTSATTPKTKKLRAHTCNNGNGDGDALYSWGVQRTSSTNCTGGTVFVKLDVEEDHRAVYYQTGAAQKCQYYTYAVNYIRDVQMAVGIMAP